MVSNYYSMFDWFIPSNISNQDYEEDYLARRNLLQARAVVSITISTFIILIGELMMEVYSLFHRNNSTVEHRPFPPLSWPILLTGILFFAVILYCISRGRITIVQAAKIWIYYFLLMSTYISCMKNGFQILSHANFFVVPPFGYIFISRRFGIQSALIVSVIYAMTFYWSLESEAITISLFSIGWVICDVYMLGFVCFLFVAYEQEFKLNQKRMRKYMEEVKSASTAKSMFISNVSHELRTPLHGILATAEILAKTRLNESQHTLLNAIESCGTNLISVINQVLTYARIEHGRLELEQNPFDIYDFVQEICDGLAPVSGRKNLDFVIHMEMNPLHRFFKGDIGVLRQIILNLLGNAIKFTDRGRIELITTELTDEEKQEHQEEKCKSKMVVFNKFEGFDVITSNSTEFLQKVKFRIEVVDTGCGIAPDFMTHLYQPFSQEDASLRRKFEGTGLGLSIVKGLLDMMNSRLEVDSNLGVGSRFSFTLEIPLSPALDSMPSSSLPFDLQYLKLLPSEQKTLANRLRSLSYAVWGREKFPFAQRITRYFDQWGFAYRLIKDDELKEDCKMKHADIVILNDSLNDLKHFLDEFLPVNLTEKLGINDLKREQRLLFFSTIGNYQDAENILKNYRSRFVTVVSKPVGPTKMLTAIIKAMESLHSSSDQSTFTNEHLISKETGSGGELFLSPSIFVPAAMTEDDVLAKNVEIFGDQRYDGLKRAKELQRKGEETDEKWREDEELSFLIVEDNKINAMILMTMLKQAGYHNYDIAANGLEAIEKFTQKSYDIIFMDLQMPICDGIEATREIRRIENGEGSNLVSVHESSQENVGTSNSVIDGNNNNERSDKKKRNGKAIIVAMTGLASYEDSRRAEGAGCDEFLTKPISIKTLNSRMKFWTREVKDLREISEN